MQLTLYRLTVFSPNWKNGFAENLQVNLLIGLNYDYFFFKVSSVRNLVFVSPFLCLELIM